jgi:hypothetical protein
MSLLKSGARSAQTERRCVGASADVSERGRLVAEVRQGGPACRGRIVPRTFDESDMHGVAGKVHVSV